MNARQTKQVGRQDGFCVFTQVEGGDDRFRALSAELLSGEGQVRVLQGTFDQTANPNTFADRLGAPASTARLTASWWRTSPMDSSSTSGSCSRIEGPKGSLLRKGAAESPAPMRAVYARSALASALASPSAARSSTMARVIGRAAGSSGSFPRTPSRSDSPCRGSIRRRKPAGGFCLGSHVSETTGGKQRSGGVLRTERGRPERLPYGMIWPGRRRSQIHVVKLADCRGCSRLGRHRQRLNALGSAPCSRTSRP